MLKSTINKFKKLILIPILGFFMATSCNENEEILNGYEKYSSYHIDGLDFYKQKEERYYIYLYSYSCPACNDMKEFLFETLNKNPKNLFLLNVREMKTETYNKFKNKNPDDDRNELAKEMIGATIIEETYLLFTPSIYEIIKDNNENKLSYYTYDFSTIKTLFNSDKIII